jgi:hypothetical protein
MRTTLVTCLTMEIAAVLDTGQHDNITLAEAKAVIRKGEVLEFLSGIGADVSPLLSAPGFPQWYATRLRELLDGYSGDERRTWGIERRGLCLLLAWTAQLIRSCEDVRPLVPSAEARA